MTLDLFAKVRVGYEGAYEAHAFRTDRLWIRLVRVNDRELLGIWGVKDGNSNSDWETVVVELDNLLQNTSPEDRPAIDRACCYYFPAGWDLWGGVPLPIQNQVLGGELDAILSKTPSTLVATLGTRRSSRG